MKKGIRIITMIVLLISLLIPTYVSADDDNQLPPVCFEHTPSSTWSYNNDFHWHVCMNCPAVLDKAAHSWNTGTIINGVMTYTCTICNMTKTEVKPSNAKKANSLSLKVSSKTYKRSALKKAKSFKIGATGVGKITYTRNAKTKKAKIKVSNNGKVTIPKKCKKGTYQITVRAAGNDKYDAGTKTVSIKVK